MTDPKGPVYGQALRHFQAARSRADLERIMARLRGKPTDLLPFEEVRRHIKGEVADARELREIPLDAIVGSVGRYKDFTRSFLPRRGESSTRWAGIEMAYTQKRLPPIHVYQVGDVYFVLDGNHRVSVARDRKATHIEAYVIKVATRLALTADDDLDDLIIKAEYADFLEATELDRTRPEVDFSVTAPGPYLDFLQEIRLHQHELTPAGAEACTGAGLSADVGPKAELPRAAVDWCDTIYLPVIREIERRGILRAFPGRTAADLYAWLIRTRAEVEEVMGWQPDANLTLAKLVERHSPKPAHVLERVGQRLRDNMVPAALAVGPEPGRWREYWQQTHRHDRLFSNILVGVDGSERGWDAVEQAWSIARREEGRVHGLHVVELDVQKTDAKATALIAEFERRRGQGGAPGRLSVEQGNLEEKLISRARWSDLVVLPLSHPPRGSGFSRLGNGFRVLLHRCSRPILAVSGPPVDFQHALLAYDGSPKAHEALFVAAYLTDRWGLRLTITGIVGARGVTTSTLHQAVDYLLQAGVPHAVVTLGAGGDSAAQVGAAIGHALQASRADLLIMGGYSKAPLVGAMAGSVVDEVLGNSAAIPILFCR